MLCGRCRRRLEQGAEVCAACGEPVAGTGLVLEVVLRDGTRTPIIDAMTLGRAPGNTLQLHDATVSRRHAVIVSGAGAPYIQDAGSSHGTFLDGRRLEGPQPLHDGSRVKLGDVELSIEARRDASQAGRTVVVHAGQSLVLPAVGGAEVREGDTGTRIALRPRVREGSAIKRLDASEGTRRFVLKDLRGDSFVRMDEDDAALFSLIDGVRPVAELLREAEQRVGPSGPARLMRLLSDLGDKGLLEGIDAATPTSDGSRLRRLLRPRVREIRGVGELAEKLYERGAWVLFTRPVAIALAALSVAGVVAFGYLIAKRYGTPFVVASHVGLGGLIFLVGRFSIVAVHELAHALAMAAHGRKVRRAGLKVVLVFPYAFVDTSDAWFEARRRRIAISAAGPACDFALGATFALLALALPGGTIRDVLFQCALAAYFGAFFNLNPFLDRDGYHMLVDRLGEPGLRQRARAWLRARLSKGAKPPEASRALKIYALCGIGWSLAAVGIAVLFTWRYYDVFVALDIAPEGVIKAGFVAMYVGLLVPALLPVISPLVGRWRSEPAQ